MKLVKIIYTAAVILGLTSCSFDFKNSSDDKWVVTNSSTQEISITFNDSKIPETIGAASVNQGKITPKVAVFNHKSDATYEIAASYHVDYTSSYNYQESSARKALFITDQKQNAYEITNSSGQEVTFKLNTLLYANTIPGGTKTEEENVMQYKITKEAAPLAFVIYKNQPSFTFYKTDSSSTLAYTTSTDTKGKTYINIK